MYRIVEDFLTEVGKVDDENALCDAFGSAIRALGCDHFCAWSSDAMPVPRAGSVGLERFPKAWLARHLEDGFWQADPLPRLSRDQIHPFLWHDPRVTARLNEEERAYMREADAAGVGGGLLVPIRVYGMPLGHVSVFGDHRYVDPRMIPKLHNLSVYFYDIVRRMVLARNGRFETKPLALNGTERECLLWLSAGKSDWEIGTILTLSEIEVRCHVANAARKLGVSNRIEAVVRAVMSHQIAP